MEAGKGKSPGGEKRIHSRLYLGLAIATQMLSLVDLTYTSLGLRFIPDSFEANPFFGGILLKPWATLGMKYVVTPLALWFLYRFRSRPMARFGLWLCFLAYLIIDGWALYVVLTYWRVSLG